MLERSQSPQRCSAGCAPGASNQHPHLSFCTLNSNTVIVHDLRSGRIDDLLHDAPTNGFLENYLQYLTTLLHHLRQMRVENFLHARFRDHTRLPLHDVLALVELFVDHLQGPLTTKPRFKTPVDSVHVTLNPNLLTYDPWNCLGRTTRGRCPQTTDSTSYWSERSFVDANPSGCIEMQEGTCALTDAGHGHFLRHLRVKILHHSQKQTSACLLDGLPCQLFCGRIRKGVHTRR